MTANDPRAQQLERYLKAINRLAEAATAIDAPDQALDVAVRTVTRSRPAVQVALWVMERRDSAEYRTASNGALTWPAAPPEEARRLRTVRAFSPGELPDAWFAGGALTRVVVIPIRVMGKRRGTAVIGARDEQGTHLLAGDETFGSGIGIFLNSIDVSRELETAWARSNNARKRLYGALDEAPLVVVLTRGPDQVLEFVNAAFVEVTTRFMLPGHPVEAKQFVGAKLWDYFAADRAKRERGWFEIVYRTGERLVRRSVPVNFGDKRRYFDYTLQPVPGRTEDVGGIIAHAIEVTDQVTAQASVDAANHRFEALVEAVQAVVREMRVDDFRCTFVSGALAKVLGYSTSEWLAEGFWAGVIHPDDRDHVLAECRRQIATRDELELDYRALTRDGQVMEIRDRLRVQRNADGQPVILRGLLVDNTERAEMDSQLLQVQKLESLGLLAGGIAHDFNNLLTGVLGSATALRHEMADQPGLIPRVDGIVRAAERAADLTRQLLAYSGKGTFDVRAVDVTAHLQDLASLLEAMLPKNVLLQLHTDDTLPAVEADPSQLQQIVMNLVLNAAEAMDEMPGTITVTSTLRRLDAETAASLRGGPIEPGPYVMVQVRDSGAGMDDATRERVFDPFFSTKGPGRGLGLAAAVGIVRSHNGGIRVKSAPGRGTVFDIFLPPTSEEPEFWDDEPTPMPGIGGTVLIIDDEEDVRFALRFMLGALGYKVLEAADGPTGIEIFKARGGGIRAVILDLTMPMMHGDEVYQALRAIRTDTPVLLSSGYDEHEATRRFQKPELAGFLKKPYTLEQLGATLAEIISRGR